MESAEEKTPIASATHERFVANIDEGASLETALPLDDTTLQTLVESLPVAIVAVDKRGVILYANRKLDDLFGYERGELVGRSLEILIPQRLRDVHVVHRDRYARSSHSRPMGTGMDLLALRKDGLEFPIEAGLSSVYLAGREITLSSIVDVSKRKHNEAILEQRVEERTREIERRRRVAESLRDIISLLNSSKPLLQVLEHITRQAGSLLDADAAAIYRLGNEQAPTAVLASWALPETLRADDFAMLLESLPAAEEETLQQHGEGKEASGTDASARDIVNLYYQAQLAIPLTAHDEVFGGLMLYYKSPRRYASDEIELAVSFGEQITLAIENERLRTSVAQAAVAAERNRIARDLHDSVSQTLFSASLIAQVLPRLWSRDHEESMRRLDELKVLTRGALAEMRSLLLELRPAALAEVEISELLRQLVEGASARARIPIALQVKGADAPPQDVKIACYHIAQEALNNVVKHARATRGEIRLVLAPGQVDLTIEDDGIGFVLQKVTPEHLGLTIMSERAEQVGGTLSIGSVPRQGSVIRFSWTASKAAEA